MAQTLIGLIVFFIFLLLLVSPIFLIIKNPGVASELAETAKTLVPWLSVILLLLTFNEGVKGIFGSIVRAIDRIKKIRAGGAETEFQDQQKEMIPLSKEQVSVLAEKIKTLETAKDSESQWAWYYFNMYLLATIYGSQIQLLQYLQKNASVASDELLNFYELFRAREPSAKEYSFQAYLNYLTLNFLIEMNAETQHYNITAHGQGFLDRLSQLGRTWTDFRG